MKQKVKYLDKNQNVINVKQIFSLVFLLIFILNCQNKPIEKNGMVYVHGMRDIDDFWMDISPITVTKFSKFIKATNYKTQADQFGDAGVFDFKSGNWSLIKGANWQYPFGKTGEKAKPNHPVTQVSWNDAMAYCKWAKKRLPTSEEYIFAEKNANFNYLNTYTWGDDFKVGNTFKANFWQGNFPLKNTIEDGFLTTSPVGYFGKNKIGLSDMGGNIWQWCSDDSKEKKSEKNQRGGSYLCDPMVCLGFKIGGVSSSTPETSLCHVGFRCVKDVD